MARIYKFGRIFKRGKYWHIDYYVDRERYRESTRETIKWKAEQYQKAKEKDILQGTWKTEIKNEKLSFEEVANEWMENYSKIYNSRSHYEGNMYRLKSHLRPFFKKKPISSITNRDVSIYLADMKKKEVMVRKKDYKNENKNYVFVTSGLSAKQINLTLDTLRMILKYALSNNYISRNPLEGIKKLREQKPAFKYLSEEETKWLLASCSPGFYPICAMAVYTGLRPSEIVGLKWNNILFDSKRIVVESSGSGPTKSRKVRYIPLNSKLEEILNNNLERKESRQYVFPTPEGKMRGGKRSRADFRSSLESAFKRAGLPKISFKDLRHTFASNFIMKGGKVLSLQKILGHADLKTTMIYAHLSPDFLGGEIDRLDFS